MLFVVIGKALTWHALGCYHLLLNRHDQAWRLFHKAAQQVALTTLLCTATTTLCAANTTGCTTIGTTTLATSSTVTAMTAAAMMFA
jgi:hypothetical protein